MKRILQSVSLAIAVLIIQIVGRVLSFDVAGWFSSDHGMGMGFYVIFYIVFYSLTIYLFLFFLSWWNRRKSNK